MEKKTNKKTTASTKKVTNENKENVSKTKVTVAAKPAAKSTTTKTKAVAKSKTTSNKTAKVPAKTATRSKTAVKAVNSATKSKSKEEQIKNFTISGFHDLALNAYAYDVVQKPKAVVVIVHGMQEHALRYENFCKFLNANCYIALATDLRGHGRTMKSSAEYGFGEKDIFSETVKDQLKVISYAHDTYHLPVYVFGHSYGSMITQNLVQQTPLIEKAVICGTTNGSCLAFKAGNVAVSIMSPFKDKNKRGGLAEKLCISSYGKNFEDGNWLTRDESVFEKYKADPLCGGSFPFSFYRSLVKNMIKTNAGIGKIGNKKLFLIAGTKDPVGENGKQVEKLYKLYLKHNVDAKLKLYADARHELVNEINKKEVYQDVLNFFDGE